MLMRARDWSTSPLGSPDTWPQSLRTVVGLMLTSKFPMFVAWGPDLIFLYNDDYAPILGAKHPTAMGHRFRDIWSEIWPDISPLIERALAGEATFHENLPLAMERRGFKEQTYFTFSYSPVRDETGAVAGMFCACTETTAQVLAEERRVAENERLRQLFHQAPGFIAVLRGPDHVFELVNASYLQLVGHRDLIGRSVRDALPEFEGQGFFELLDSVYTSGQPFVGRGQHLKVQPSPNLPIEDRFADFVYQPVRDEHGQIVGIFVEGSDVTDTKRVEEALRESEARLRLAIDAGRMAVWEWDAQTDLLRESPELNRLLGFPPDHRLTREEAAARCQPGERERVEAAARMALANGNRHFEVEFQYGLWGAPQWLLLRAEILVDRTGAPAGMTGVLLDITDRKKWEEHLELLVNELNHRVKNTLATVQSIASQTLRNADTMAEAQAVFEARLMALSRAHDILTRENWDGAEMSEIVSQALSPYQNLREERFHVTGPHVRLAPRMALALSMALHELATNAVKYGALSNAAGELHLTWSVDRSISPARLRLRWEEKGGPPVTPPKRRGFGSRLIERSLAQDLEGDAKIEFAPTGVVCTVDAPLLP